VIDRSNIDDWLRSGRSSIGSRARERVRALVTGYPGSPLDPEVQKELFRIARYDAVRNGMGGLPDHD
jgi:trimethylamine:corrinoid methyltransferase-like protein